MAEDEHRRRIKGRVDAALRHEDLKAIVRDVNDLAFYRTCNPGVADDLQRATIRELADRVSKLPEWEAGE